MIQTIATQAGLIMLDNIAGVYSFFVGDLKFYWICAIFGSAIFIVQLLLGFFAGVGDLGHDGDIGMGGHADTGFADFRFMSLRTVIAFITFFGWGGVIFGKSGISGFFAALACGAIMMTATAMLIYFLMKLEQSGNVSADEYVNLTGTVYLSIPGSRSKPGIVSVSIRGSLRQIDALADEAIPTGASVRIVQNIDGQRFIVEKI